MRTTTGDENVTYKTKAVILTHLATVLKTDLTDETAMINQYHDSGKQLGAAVLGVDSLTTNANPVLYIASGPNPDDAWLAQGGGTGGTPPGNATTSVAGLVKQATATANFAASDVAGLVTELNAFLTKYKASGQGA